jgi:hypothetical protein
VRRRIRRTQKRRTTKIVARNEKTNEMMVAVRPPLLRAFAGLDGNCRTVISMADTKEVGTIETFRVIQ